MGLVNARVRLGDPVVYNRDCFRHVSRRGLGQVPGMSGTPTAPINPLEIGGFAIGTGLIIGGVLVKGPGGTVMLVSGGVAAGFSVLSIMFRMLSKSMSSAFEAQAAQNELVSSAGGQRAVVPPPPAPPPRMTRTQTVAAYSAAIAPAAAAIFQGLANVI